MKYLIDLGTELVGLNGHISKDVNNDFAKYIERFGFNSSEDARECAEQLGIQNAKIIIVGLA